MAEFCFVAILAASVIAAGYAEHVIATRRGHGRLVAHTHGHEMSGAQLVAHMVKDTLAFTLGWSLLTLVKLTFWSATDDNGILGGGNVMTSHVVIVFISSLVTFASFLILDYSADRLRGHFGRGLRSLGKSFMLLLGLAWEGAFWEGARSMSQGMNIENKAWRMMVVILSSFTLCAIVMPAWIIYIVPHSVELKEDELHIKDYDDHLSRLSPRSRKTTTTCVVTIAGQPIVDDESGSTRDEEAPLSTPTSPRSSIAVPDTSQGHGSPHHAAKQLAKLASLGVEVRVLVSL